MQFPTFSTFAAKFTNASPPPAFGLDMSDDAIKIAQFRTKGKKMLVDFVANNKMPSGAINEGDIVDAEKVTQAIKKAIAPYKRTVVRGVVASLPEPKTFLQTVTVPKKETNNFTDRVKESIPEYLPMAIDEIYYDTQVVNENENEWRVIIGAAPKQTVDAYISVLEAANLIPMGLALEASSIVNMLISQEANAEEKPRAIIDLGCRRASLILHDYGAPQFTLSLPIAGHKVTKQIASALEITPEQAEKAKRTCGLDPDKCEGVLRLVLEEMVEQMIKRIEQANDYYMNHFTAGREISEIVLCGGGAHLASLDEVLKNATNIPVRIANVWQLLPVERPQILDSPLRFTTVLGLAARGLTADLHL